LILLSCLFAAYSETLKGKLGFNLTVLYAFVLAFAWINYGLLNIGDWLNYVLVILLFIPLLDCLRVDAKKERNS